MSHSEDEYDAFNFDEFTPEDFAIIDSNNAVTQNAYDSTSDIRDSSISMGGPTITIELEKTANTVVVKDSLQNASLSRQQSVEQTQLSPFERHRSWNQVLSVTDLVGPAWCEVQFDYGLRQMRFKKLEQRPASFTTSEGKVITVEKKVAASNDRTVKRGQAVHKVLEKEIRPVEVRVDITTDEERWALRLINMLACVQSLTTLGCAREMPVFGIVHDEIIVGIIDEVLRKYEPILESKELASTAKRASESSHMTPKKKRTRRTPSPSQPQLTSFFPSPAKVEHGVSAASTEIAQERPSTPPLRSRAHADEYRPTTFIPTPNFSLYLVDTKTRRLLSLPDDVDTKSSRLQLMLYHRLLSTLLVSPFQDCRHTSASSFNFAALWSRLGLDPLARFSSRFMGQAGMALGVSENIGSQAGFDCLDGLVLLWWNQIQALDIRGIDQNLQIIYRTQPKFKKKSKSNGTRRRQDATTITSSIVSPEEDDLARAIEASLQYMPQDRAGISPSEETVAEALAIQIKASGSSLVRKSDDIDVLTADNFEQHGLRKEIEDDPDLIWALQQSLLTSTSGQSVVGEDAVLNPSSSSGPSAPPTSASVETSVILGTKDFKMNDLLLDAHLTDVLQWWHGERPPRGVEVSLSRRCFTCEYMEGCEWREKKAEEVNKSFQDRKKGL